MGDQHDLTNLFSWPSNLPKSYFSSLLLSPSFVAGPRTTRFPAPAFVNSRFPVILWVSGVSPRDLRNRLR
jgi:hypothetical protein